MVFGCLPPYYGTTIFQIFHLICLLFRQALASACANKNYMEIINYIRVRMRRFCLERNGRNIGDQGHDFVRWQRVSKYIAETMQIKESQVYIFV